MSYSAFLVLTRVCFLRRDNYGALRRMNILRSVMNLQNCEQRATNKRLKRYYGKTKYRILFAHFKYVLMGMHHRIR